MRDVPACRPQAVYTALKETETRATDLLPYWKVPLLCAIIPRQRKALEAVELIRDTTTSLIKKCKAMVDEEEMKVGLGVRVLDSGCTARKPSKDCQPRS